MHILGACDGQDIWVVVMNYLVMAIMAVVLLVGITIKFFEG